MDGRLDVPDSVVRCPYNESHLIASSRIQKHILKCEKKFPEDFKVMCPYNASHRLFKSDLEEHIVTCPMRRVLKPELYEEPPQQGAIYCSSEISSIINCEENWNDPVDTLSFTDCYSVSSSNVGVPLENLPLSLKNDMESDNVRAPRGFSEALLIDVSDDTSVYDLESVVSGMGMGRGNNKLNYVERLKRIGLGRGKPLN